MHPGYDAQRRIQDSPTDSHRLVGIIIPGQRHHGHALPVRHAGIDKHIRRAAVGREKEREIVELLDLDARGPFPTRFDNHHVLPHAIEHAGQHDPALAVPDNQDERLLHRRNSQGKATPRHGIAQGLVL